MSNLGVSPDQCRLPSGYNTRVLVNQETTQLVLVPQWPSITLPCTAGKIRGTAGRLRGTAGSTRGTAGSTRGTAGKCGYLCQYLEHTEKVLGVASPFITEPCTLFSVQGDSVLLWNNHKCTSKLRFTVLRYRPAARVLQRGLRYTSCCNPTRVWEFVVIVC